MKIAVIGAGIFGCTAAIHCARAGHEVDIFDHGPLLGGATGHNQFRLHQGYHYPRSPATISECKNSLRSFENEYQPAIVYGGGDQFYAIANGSRTSAVQYEGICRAHALPFYVYRHGPELRNVEMVACVAERRLDIDVLRLIIKRRLHRYGMAMLRDPLPGGKYRQLYDRIIVATYAGMNRVLDELGCPTRDYQFEVVEKPVIRLPLEFEKIGVVVMDGPFFSVDPYMETGNHLFGHVEHAIWSCNVGRTAEVPTGLAELINRGVIHEPRQSRFETMRDAAAEFMPVMKDAEHIGSMFTIRVVLPNVDATDERPTLVERVDDQVLLIFGGKLPTAVEAAKQAVAMIGEGERMAA